MRVTTSKKIPQQCVTPEESVACKATDIEEPVEAKSRAVDSPNPAPRRKYKSAKAKAKSETVSDLKSATDATLTIQQALDLSPPTLGDGIEAARDYINKVHPVIRNAEGSLTELVARIGTILLAYRNSEHGAYGKWEPFLEQNFPLSKRTARNYMSVALETTPEERAGKPVTEVYEMIGVVKRPGEKANSRFLARLEEVQDFARSCVEHIHGIATRFENAVEPYDGANRDIGGYIAFSCDTLREQLDTCIAAAKTVKKSVAMLAESKAPDGTRFVGEELHPGPDEHDTSVWSDLPEGTIDDGTNIMDLPCCEKEAIMSGLGRSDGKCRECGKKMKARKR